MTDNTTPWYTTLDTSDQGTLNVLYYGKEGSGKTINALHAAKLGKTLVINAEGGARARAMRQFDIPVNEVAVYPRNSTDRLTYAKLDRLYREILADLKKDPTAWYAIVFDSITEIHQQILDEASERRKKQARDRGVDIDEWFTDRGDYGVMGKMLRDLLKKYRDLPCHVIITALVRQDKDDQTGAIYNAPAVTPGLMTDLLGYVDVVMACVAADEEKPFRGATGGMARWRTKDRIGAFPRVMANPTFDRMVGYYADEIEESTDPDQKLLG